MTGALIVVVVPATVPAKTYELLKLVYRSQPLVRELELVQHECQFLDRFLNTHALASCWILEPSAFRITFSKPFLRRGVKVL